MMIDWPEDYADKDKCRTKIYVRDTYRRTGRGKYGFEMHYNERQCSRKVTVLVASEGGRGYCKVHAKMNGIANVHTPVSAETTKHDHI